MLHGRRRKLSAAASTKCESLSGRSTSSVRRPLEKQIISVTYPWIVRPRYLASHANNIRRFEHIEMFRDALDRYTQSRSNAYDAHLFPLREVGFSNNVAPLPRKFELFHESGGCHLRKKFLTVILALLVDNREHLTVEPTDREGRRSRLLSTSWECRMFNRLSSIHASLGCEFALSCLDRAKLLRSEGELTR